MIKVTLKQLSMTPQKMRLMAKLIRGMSVSEARLQLEMSPRRGALPFLKLLKSALAIAKQKEISEKSLVIKEIIVNEGPKRKRHYAMSRGHVGVITKRSSHILLTLDTNKKEVKKENSIAKKETKVKEEKKEIKTKTTPQKTPVQNKKAATTEKKK